MVEVSTDMSWVEFQKVHEWLSQSYWASERTFEEQKAAIEGSLNFSARRDGAMVGFARIVTDFQTFAWICDVIVDPDCRGQGIGTMLMDAVFAESQLKDVKRFMLGTRDAHALYEKYGFESMEQGRIMRRGFKPLELKPSES